MAVSYASFVARFAEFERVDQTTVEAAIAEAGRRVDGDVWGTLEDDGVMLLAAHNLAVSPFGQQARMASKDGETTYGKQHAVLVRQVSYGWRVV